MTYDLAALIQELTLDEGNRTMPYVDTVGKITIGCGRNLTDNGVSQSEISFMLNNDIRRADAGLCVAIPWWGTLSDARQRVLLNMVFNMGVKGLMEFKAMLAACKAADFETAADQMLASTWATEVGQRARRLAAMMRQG